MAAKTIDIDMSQYKAMIIKFARSRTNFDDTCLYLIEKNKGIEETYRISQNFSGAYGRYAYFTDTQIYISTASNNNAHIPLEIYATTKELRLG